MARPAPRRSRRRSTATPAEVLFLREGGSGPEADLVEQLGAPLLFLGAGLPTDRIHSPNERVLLPMLCTAAPRRPRTCGASWPRAAS